MMKLLDLTLVILQLLFLELLELSYCIILFEYY